MDAETRGRIDERLEELLYRRHLARARPRATSPPPPGTARLRQATIVLSDAAELERAVGRLEAHGHEVQETARGAAVRDPSVNPLGLTVAPA